MNLKKMIGFGILVWIGLFVVVFILIALKLFVPGQQSIVVALAGGVIAYVLAGYAKPQDQKEALMIGASWAVVSIVLDALITTRFASSAIFQMWTLWFEYALILGAPLLRVKRS